MMRLRLLFVCNVLPPLCHLRLCSWPPTSGVGTDVGAVLGCDVNFHLSTRHRVVAFKTPSGVPKRICDAPKALRAIRLHRQSWEG